MQLIIIVFDLLILFINIYYFFDINSQKDFKNIDLYFLKLNSKSFYQISKYLNLKYQIVYNINNTLEKCAKKTISLYFINFKNRPVHNFLINKTIEILKANYYVNIDPYNPDYIIYNMFGCKHLKSIYNNSIKIAFYTENQIPDFNTADYCIGHSHLNYLDRYLKIPYYFSLQLFFKKDEIKEIRKRNVNISNKKKFCAALISNIRVSDYFRINFINELNKYKVIDMGGTFRNNVGKIKNKLQFLSSSKFSIAIENAEGD